MHLCAQTQITLHTRSHLLPGLVPIAKFFFEFGLGDQLEDVVYGFFGDPLVSHPVNGKGGHSLVGACGHLYAGVEGVLLEDLAELLVREGDDVSDLGFRQFLDCGGRGRRLPEGVDLVFGHGAAGIGEGHHAGLDLVEQTNGAQHIAGVEHGTGTGGAQRYSLAGQVAKRLDAAARTGHKIGGTGIGLGNPHQHVAFGEFLEGGFLLAGQVDVGALADAHFQLTLEKALGVFGGSAGGYLVDVVVG